MRYLMRESALFNDKQWKQIDDAVIAEARKVLTCRRFISIAGPYGAETQNVALDICEEPDNASIDFWGDQDKDQIAVTTRRFIELASIYSDFSISWRDIEADNAGLQQAINAAMMCARKEDELIFYGNPERNVDGIFTVAGTNRLALSDWSEGENPVLDVTKALETLIAHGCSGQRALVISIDLYTKLHRLQPGTGIMELDRVQKLVGGTVYKSSRLKKNQAALLYCDQQNIDLAIGQDMITAYLGNEKLDHLYRVMETAALRIKRPAAIAILE